MSCLYFITTYRSASFNNCFHVKVFLKESFKEQPVSLGVITNPLFVINIRTSWMFETL